MNFLYFFPSSSETMIFSSMRIIRNTCLSYRLRSDYQWPLGQRTFGSKIDMQGASYSPPPEDCCLKGICWIGDHGSFLSRAFQGTLNGLEGPAYSPRHCPLPQGTISLGAFSAKWSSWMASSGQDKKRFRPRLFLPLQGTIRGCKMDLKISKRSEKCNRMQRMQRTHFCWKHNHIFHLWEKYYQRHTLYL